jgi:hypothetical protein
MRRKNASNPLSNAILMSGKTRKTNETKIIKVTRKAMMVLRRTYDR